MTATELIAALIALDPRRDYYLRHMTANVFDAGGRLELADTFRLIVAPGFNGQRKCVIEGESWQEISEGAAVYVKAGIEEEL